MKIQTFGWKTCICHYEFDSIPIFKDLSDEISGDAEGHFFFDIVY